MRDFFWRVYESCLAMLEKIKDISLVTALDFYHMTRGFNEMLISTNVACRQETLTFPENWSLPE